MYDVLIIDDEPWSREVVKALGEWNRLALRVAGEAEDGRSGVRRIEELQPQIVVTDMRMPGLDGVELLQTLKERFPSLKIIVMSGYDDYMYLREAIHSRAVDYLLKPLDPEQLNAALEKCVRELEREQRSVEALWKQPLVFEDAAVLDEYLACRQLVFGFLLELDAEGVQSSLDKLAAILEQSPAVPLDGTALVKLGQDFLLLLEQFAAEHELDLHEMMGERRRERAAASGWASAGELIVDIGHLYRDAIAAARAKRRQSVLDLEEVKAHIDRHYQEPISLDALARRFFVSREHLSRTFKAHVGEGLTEYIVRKRMEKARELIAEREMPIKRVAELVGYADLSYFYRVFKKHFGFPPGDLRKPDGSLR